MNLILIGNIVALAGAAVMVASGFIKNRKNVLIAQCGQFAIMGVSNLILGGVTGMISNVVSILRNIICLKREFTIPLKIFFIAIQLILSARVNTMGLIGWFPIIAACIFTWFLDTKSDLFLKFIIIVTMLPWCVYDFVLYNYVSFAFDVFTIISNTIGIIMLLRDRWGAKKEG